MYHFFLKHCLIALFCLIALNSFAQPASIYTQQFKLTAFEGDTMDWFGYSVDQSGMYAIVGAPGDDELGGSAGAAYLLKNDSGEWTTIQKIMAEDGMGGDLFGISVSIDSMTAIVGAVGHDENGAGSGTAYIFMLSDGIWTQTQKLTPSDPEAGDQFGRSVDIQDDVLIIGARLADIIMGAAYIYRFNGANWMEEEKLSASDADFNDEYGFSVAIEGDLAAVGAFGEGDFFDPPGAVYTYSFDGLSWSDEEKLQASDTNFGDEFGFSIAISGSSLVIGAKGDDEAALDAGAAYLFDYDGLSWSESQKILPFDLSSNDEFGFSVDIDEDKLIIGAKNSLNRGSAYLFKNDGAGWLPSFKLTASDPQAGDEFGFHVSIEDSLVFIGSRKEDQIGPDAGSVYVFKNIAFPQCNMEGAKPIGLTAIPAPSGTNVLLSWNILEGADFYQIKGKKTGTTAIGSLITPNNSKIIGGLTSGASYEWKIRARCDYEEVITAFSETDTFMMPSAKSTLQSVSTIKISPNPSTDLTILSIEGKHKEQYTLEIIDINHKLIFNTLNIRLPYQLNTSRLSSGVYSVKLTGSMYHTAVLIVK